MVQAGGDLVATRRTTDTGSVEAFAIWLTMEKRMTSTLDDKIRSAFGEFAVDKGLIRRMGVSGDDRHVPSYVMDWIVTYTAKTQKTTSSLERAVQEFIAKHLPAKGEKERIRFKLAQGEVLTVLDAVSVTETTTSAATSCRRRAISARRCSFTTGRAKCRASSRDTIFWCSTKPSRSTSRRPTRSRPN